MKLALVLTALLAVLVACAADINRQRKAIDRIEASYGARMWLGGPA